MRRRDVQGSNQHHHLRELSGRHVLGCDRRERVHELSGRHVFERVGRVGRGRLHAMPGRHGVERGGGVESRELFDVRERLVLVRRRVELRRCAESELLGVSGEHVLRGRGVRGVRGWLGVGRGERGVRVRGGLHEHVERLPGVPGGHVQARGGDGGVPELSSEQRVGERERAVRVCGRVHWEHRRGVRGVRRREVQECDGVGGVCLMCVQAELAGGGAEHHELPLRRRVHAGRERDVDDRGGVRAGVRGLCTGHVQGAGGRAGVHHVRAEPVVRRGNDSVLVRARVHRAGRRAVR